MDAGQTVRIEQLELEQFRVYENLTLHVPATGMRVVGPNGSGKSTLLEAVELLSTTRPRRGALDSDLIRHGSGSDLGVPPYARVVGLVDRGGAEARLEIFIQRSEKRNTSKKLLRVADRPRRAADVVGLVPSVTFAPDGLDLVLGSPSVRRRFLDVLLSQTDRRYLRYLSRYTKILAQRNGLLRHAAGGGSSGHLSDEFAFWDEQLVALGAYIIAARATILHTLADSAAAEFARLSAQSGALGLRYQSSIKQPEAWWRSVARESDDATGAAQRVGSVLEQQLRQALSADIARGSTSIGPHRDDVLITLGEYDLSRFGSRGQQRLAVLAIKIAEIAAIVDTLDVRPVLLLDDVLSELDRRHQQTLLDATLTGQGQVFITSTDERLLTRPELADLGLAILAAPGQIEQRR